MKYAAVAFLLSGCVIVPSTKTTIKDAGTEQSQPILGTVKATVIEARASTDTIHIRATRKRECERQVQAVRMVTTSKHAKLGGVQDPRGRIFGLLLSPVTIPISAAITGLVLAGAEDKTERATTVISSTKYECVDVAAGTEVRIVLPSGRTVDRTADDKGEIAFAIPDTEPYAGAIGIYANQTTTKVAYARPMPAVTAAREAMKACATQHKQAGLVVKVAVDEEGSARNVTTDVGGADLAGCVTSGIAKLRFVEAHRGTTLVFKLHPGA